MKDPLSIRDVRVYRLGIPMRFKFEHALASRDVADPVVVACNGAAPYAHVVGYGETLARAYVTGESADSAVDDVLNIFCPLLAEFRAASFVEALERIDALPMDAHGRIIHAARAAVELALIDLACRAFGRRPADVAGWLGLPGFGSPGCVDAARYSGIVLGRSKSKLQWLIRLQRLAGIRDFKLKVATEGWEDRLTWTHRVLAGAIRRGAATLRVDANAGWTLAEANEAASMLEEHGVSAVEQPLTDAHDADLSYLAEQMHADLIADESMLGVDDTHRLIEGGGVRVFNIRLAKNGGLMPALKIARVVLAAKRDVQLGCLVGETSILSAAGLAFLEAVPRARFIEGAYGPLLLRRDVTAQPVRFGLGGRIKPRRGFGFGVNVDTAALEAVSVDRPHVVQL